MHHTIQKILSRLTARAGILFVALLALLVICPVSAFADGAETNGGPKGSTTTTSKSGIIGIVPIPRICDHTVSSDVDSLSY